MSNLEKILDRCRASVDAELERRVSSAETEPQRLHRAIRWSLFAGGKRFRPALVLIVGEAFGADEKSLLPTACAIEMIHTYSLIHDDLPAMDDDDLRRGRATCHKKFDEATAILAGDRLHSLAFQIIAEDENLSAETKVGIIAEITNAAAKMVDGQHLDLAAEGKIISVEQLETIHQNKTAALVFASARAGAIIASASETEIEAVSNYASSLGLLFQITDDLLDVTGTTESLGKTAGKDLTSEKATYPALFGLEETREKAASVYREAIEALEIIDKDTALLGEIAAYILNRKK
jgi:geranylgeranyl diphosphate synthase, type II